MHEDIKLLTIQKPDKESSTMISITKSCKKMGRKLCTIPMVILSRSTRKQANTINTISIVLEFTSMKEEAETNMTNKVSEFRSIHRLVR
jgi:plasmid replication initiation protein